ncbi:TetR/AcrR family transcriptional regulator [Pelagibacterium xiamenense]|uniref:TetR/AcrR family transcriptional regulator n=1 Tax=Pelagibacterium xiamenense TaxID=2901140 RepID=UPI001E5F1AD6|nr:TetR/AcrR family transcriptional regulator [Pelagibacterium xiamenense]
MAARKNKTQRQAEILDAAAALFLAHGFEATTLSAIIARTGGSRRDIYALFGDKDALFVAAMRRLFETALAPLGSIAEKDGPPEAVLAALGRQFLTLITAPDMLASYRLILAEIHRFPELGQAFYEAGPSRAYPAVAAYLKRATSRGALAVEDPDRAAIVFLEMVKGDLQHRVMFVPGSRLDAGAIETQVAAAVSIFLDGTRMR